LLDTTAIPSTRFSYNTHGRATRLHHHRPQISIGRLPWIISAKEPSTSSSNNRLHCAEPCVRWI
jgi:hypothetical protein